MYNSCLCACQLYHQHLARIYHVHTHCFDNFFVFPLVYSLTLFGTFTCMSYVELFTSIIIVVSTVIVATHKVSVIYFSCNALCCLG